MTVHELKSGMFIRSETEISVFVKGEVQGFVVPANCPVFIRPLNSIKRARTLRTVLKAAEFDLTALSGGTFDQRKKEFQDKLDQVRQLEAQPGFDPKKVYKLDPLLVIKKTLAHLEKEVPNAFQNLSEWNSNLRGMVELSTGQELDEALVRSKVFNDASDKYKSVKEILMRVYTQILLVDVLSVQFPDFAFIRIIKSLHTSCNQFTQVKNLFEAATMVNFFTFEAVAPFFHLSVGADTIEEFLNQILANAPQNTRLTVKRAMVQTVLPNTPGVATMDLGQVSALLAASPITLDDQLNSYKVWLNSGNINEHTLIVKGILTGFSYCVVKANETDVQPVVPAAFAELFADPLSFRTATAEQFLRQQVGNENVGSILAGIKDRKATKRSLLNPIAGLTIPLEARMALNAINAQRILIHDKYFRTVSQIQSEVKAGGKKLSAKQRKEIKSALTEHTNSMNALRNPGIALIFEPRLWFNSADELVLIDQLKQQAAEKQIKNSKKINQALSQYAVMMLGDDRQKLCNAMVAFFTRTGSFTKFDVKSVNLDNGQKLVPAKILAEIERTNFFSVEQTEETEEVEQPKQKVVRGKKASK